jgi:mRNA interferase MazF
MKRGEVVFLDWPFSDRTGSKVRPAVVVQADFLNGRLADTVLVLISRTSRAPGVTEVLLDPAVETLSGLRHVSVASCNNLLTVDQGLIVRTVGQLSNAAMAQVDAALKTALQLP